MALSRSRNRKTGRDKLRTKTPSKDNRRKARASRPKSAGQNAPRTRTPPEEPDWIDQYDRITNPHPFLPSIDPTVGPVGAEVGPVGAGPEMMIDRPTFEGTGFPSVPITVGDNYDPEVGGDLLEQELAAMRANDPVQEYWRNRLDFDPEAEAMQETGPNASALSGYLNNPDMERPPIRPGWKTRFAGMGADRAARRREDTRTAYSGLETPVDAEGKSPEELKGDVRGAREGEWADLSTRRMDEGLPIAQGQGPDAPVPMTTHPGTATSGVSATPRSLARVRAELNGVPNFDHAAGPQNEQWQAAREQRATERDRRLARHQAGEARKARGREQRLEARRAAPRPRTAGGMGALWRIDPMKAAQLQSRQQDRRQQGALQSRRLGIEERRLGTEQDLNRAQIGKMEADTEAARTAIENYTKWSKQVKSLDEQLTRAEERGDRPSEINGIRDRLEDAREREARALRTAQGGANIENTVGGGNTTGPSRPGTVATQEEVDQLSSVSETSYGQRLNLDGANPERGRELAQVMVNDASSDGFAVPGDDSIENMIPALREDADVARKDGVLGTDQAGAIASAAAPMEGDPNNEDEAIALAKQRIKAALKYINGGADGDGPTVGGYRLRKVERETGDPNPPTDFSGWSPPRPTVTEYRWIKVD